MHNRYNARIVLQYMRQKDSRKEVKIEPYIKIKLTYP